METFLDLKVPFPLYGASVSTCGDYARAQNCCVTKQNSPHCFRLGVGSWIVTSCEKCGFHLCLSSSGGRVFSGNCGQCGAFAAEESHADGDAYISYEALRSGLGGYTKDTPYGMISWQQLQSGWTQGIPGGTFSNMETRVTESGWTQVKLPLGVLREITRTPDFNCNQGAIWQFCGAKPLVYVGEWRWRDFEKNAPRGVSAEQFLCDVLHIASASKKSLDGRCVYVFVNPEPDNYSGYYEVD